MPSGSDSGSYDPLLALDDGMADGDVSSSAAAPVDHRGRPALRGATGGWSGGNSRTVFRSTGFLANLITYLTGSLGEGNPAAA
ncbi:hypothetical protein OsJ_18645 [Oryza sativa Japonica Group]|uniref:Uncharacterized protein n=1 Tax=Oryza sativa subsp. japonica TaxID=39947 RepID=B9FIZ0_ORYSJ|nr:hypothetical protein OsJ_18645 [Oryza sativa Japonica Group]